MDRAVAVLADGLLHVISDHRRARERLPEPRHVVFIEEALREGGQGRRLEENELKSWRKDMWCIPQVDVEYVARPRPQ